MKAAIVSLRFAPGHVAHLRAYMKIFCSLGCETRLFLHSGYSSFINMTEGVVYFNTINDIINWNPDFILSYNIANENIKLAKECKSHGIKFFYVLHEPIEDLKPLLAEGKRIPRRVAANTVNYLTCKNSYKVVLASERGKEKFEKHMRRSNSNYDVFPLIFCDEFDSNKEIGRQFFSFIGGFVKSRGTKEFLDFMKWSLEKNLGIKFLIASRSVVDSELADEMFKKAIKDGSLVLDAGRPMTSNEINQHYRESICVWNGYISSTQSGVLGNALMQGAPIIATKRADTIGIISNKENGCFISVPYDNQEIYDAYSYIKENLDHMVAKARMSFMTLFNYSSSAELARKVFEIK